jgi:hypothetical protein
VTMALLPSPVPTARVRGKSLFSGLMWVYIHSNHNRCLHVYYLRVSNSFCENPEFDPFRNDLQYILKNTKSVKSSIIPSHLREPAMSSMMEPEAVQQREIPATAVPMLPSKCKSTSTIQSRSRFSRATHHRERLLRLEGQHRRSVSH